jgi:phosphoribosylanthranilate isomerase
MALFRVKICGVTRPDDAAGIAAAGADAIGLNFYPQSARFVDDVQAAAIVAALPGGIAKVGVFVNAPADVILGKVEQLGLDWVQLHGDEPAEFVEKLPGIKVLRAVRLQDRVSAVVPTKKGLLIRLPAAVLIDAYAPGTYGGTGQTVDWRGIAVARRRLAGLPIVLAGGLTPENVATAIATARPDAVDTASGVESSPGVKDLAKVQAFLQAATASWPQSSKSG